MMKHTLSIDIEHEDQRALAQDLYQAIPADKMTAWLENTVNNLISAHPDHAQVYPALAKELLEIFSTFYLALIFVDSEKSQALNHQYRQKNKPTNILSFPSAIPIDFYKTLPHEEQQFTLGDLVVDLSVIKKESEEQHKKLDDHLAHILVHGLLHLFGFDHENVDDAMIMESLEIELLHHLGIINPYESD